MRQATLIWAIIYPKGDRTRLKAVEIMNFEMCEFDLACEEEFDSEEECNERMVQLAKKHGLQHSAPQILS